MEHSVTMEQRTQAATANENLRGAQRFTLLIRTAKLVCESGEFLCVIRDVSETGLRLKLFHHLPQDRHLALELANGEVYFVEKVWERDGHAGFRFAAPIDVQGFIAEVSPFPRRQVRLRMHEAATVGALGVSADAVIRDLSQRGARIETGRQLAIGQPVRIEAAGLPSVQAKVAWRNGMMFGLAFVQVFTLDEVARIAALMQLPGGHGSALSASCA